jgi:hypothetical protein
MTKYVLLVTYDGGVVETPMTEWAPDDVQGHLDYYADLNDELVESGELVQTTILTGQELGVVVRCDGRSAPDLADGPFPGNGECLAGFQMVDVESRERALQIAARFSAVPGPDGVPLQQPIEVRQVMSGGCDGDL